ncbi:glycosyltransferase family 2 protein [Tessaracoccus palaemonis]|uniref:Glycosyltransferase family 2 protein n=1 Tax=Tessaracoccus palaemonis TaxID=2829499 RepID=A0ABX8SHU9_9ACTN|nr:glycosyltransferase family A protein [Tessaracoccus palaemonis]QXT62962.1 glycosyltransferase family 2 protein [Tessaracoccus palaemonis]
MGTELAASVIIPCHGADEFLPLQLEALARQDGAPPFEVLLVDNGANEDLPGLADRWRVQLPNVRIIDATARRGTGYARNVGIGAARAPLLLFCDCDDVVMPEWVRLGVLQLGRHPVFSGGAVPVTDELCRQGWKAAVDHVGPHEDVPDGLPLSGTSTYPILMGCSFGITAELARRLGGFDLSFGSQGEDNDLAFRIVASGLTLPDAGPVCIAYRCRIRPDSFRRGMSIARSHALLCARHHAWASSPAYQGHWLLRPLRTVALIATGRRPPRWREDLGRQVGLILGRVRFVLLGAPRPHLAIGIGNAVN